MLSCTQDSIRLPALEPPYHLPVSIVILLGSGILTVPTRRMRGHHRRVSTAYCALPPLSTRTVSSGSCGRDSLTVIRSSSITLRGWCPLDSTTLPFLTAVLLSTHPPASCHSPPSTQWRLPTHRSLSSSTVATAKSAISARLLPSCQL